MSLRDVTIAQMGNGATQSGWRHTPEARRGFYGIWKSQLVELSPALEEDGWLSFASGGLRQVLHEMVGGRWKSQNRKNVYLSPCVKEPLNWKVIKSFVPELRSRKCFSCFEIPMFYVCMCVCMCIYIYIYIYMNIMCPFRISISGYDTYIHTYTLTYIYIYIGFVNTFWR